jgi:hypothetical protein
MRALRWIAALAGLAAFVMPASADYIILDLSSLSADNATATAINDNGAIVGNYQSGSNYYGFLLNGSSLSQIAYPGATQTYANGINDAGVIVGDYINGTGSHGFIYYNGTFTTVDNGTNTGLTGINNSGEYVGHSSTGYFYWNGSSPVPLPDTVTLSGIGDFSGTNIYYQGISDTDYVIGNYYHPSWEGFVYNLTSSSFTAVTPPNPECNYGNLNGISGNGVAIGVYGDCAGAGGAGGYLSYTYDTNTGINTLLPAYSSGWYSNPWLNGIDNWGRTVGFIQQGSIGSYEAVASIPEPGTLLLAAAGVLAMLLRRTARLVYGPGRRHRLPHQAFGNTSP